MKTGKEKRNFIVIGGGLSGCLALHCLHYYFPHKSILLIERSDALCSPHTWSFHASDIPEAQKSWLTPLISHSWAQYHVYFPDYERTLHTSYHSIRSSDLALKTFNVQGPNIEILCSTEATITSPTTIRIDNTTLTADLVIDARGWTLLSGPLGFQKFLGLELELDTSHGISSPTLKDARLEQTDGYRFMYVLPWDETHLLVEDTYYSNSGELDFQKSESDILKYAQDRGWKVKRILSREHGSLPLILSTQRPQLETVTVGARTCFYQPVTGYTFPQTMQTIDWLVPLLQQAFMASDLLAAEQQWLSKKKWKQQLYLFLNRMLFLSASPKDRYKVLQRFYKLSPDLIHRFYAAQNRIFDFVRIFSGKPPVPISRVPRALLANKKRQL